MVVILDAEELDAQEREQSVKNQISMYYNVEEIGFEIEVIVCNHCFETWLLGCCGLCPTGEIDQESDFYPYYCNYNTQECDPEEMKPPEENTEAIAKYHFHYLHELLRYRKIRYSKNRPKHVATELYFNGIVQRINTTEHLKSFKWFYDYICRYSLGT